MDLTKILKNVPKGTKLYSPFYGEVEFDRIIDEEDCTYCIGVITVTQGKNAYFAKNGTIDVNFPGECMLFPSKDNRDWESFAASLNICPFKPYDKVLVRDNDDSTWLHEIFGIYMPNSEFPYQCLHYQYRQCIPYEGNEHLLGTSNKPTK